MTRHGHRGKKCGSFHRGARAGQGYCRCPPTTGPELQAVSVRALPDQCDLTEPHYQPGMPVLAG